MKKLKLKRVVFGSYGRVYDFGGKKK